MILKALTLENFKGIREPVRIEFAPLTLLFGPNNAGKSTIVQALMYAHEVLERNNCDAGRTELGGAVVDLGGFRNLVHGQDVARAIRMRFELDLSPNGLPSFMSVEKREDLERREYALECAADWTLEDALGVRRQFSWALGQITNVWVEFEIANQRSSSSQRTHNPVVRRYSVGSGSTLYATITLPDDSGRAALTYFNFGLPPFGWSYTKGESSDFEWDFARLVRRTIQLQIDQLGSTSFGLKKGAMVAFAGEPSGPDTNLMSRGDFDALVDEIVAGEGKWGENAINPATVQPTLACQRRRKMIEEAYALGRLRAHEAEQHVGDSSPLPMSPEEIEALFVAPDAIPSPDEALLWPSGGYAIDREELMATEEWRGWLFDWVTALSRHPRDYDEPATWKWGADDPVGLTIRDTALPDWRQEIQPYTDIWLSEKDKDVEGIAGWLSLGQEYLLDFLSAIIVGPGRLLLAALQGSTYLGPFRKFPSRHYLPTNGPTQESWANGLAAWNLLTTESEQPLIDAVNDWLLSSERFGTGYRIEIQRRKRLDVRSPLWGKLMTGNLADQAEAIRQELANLPEETVKLEFVNEVSGLALAPQDLGVGISQVIPVIVAALHNKSGVVAVEEPESNIHPAFQSVLADLFITQAKANPNILFLIETHSEHLMLRCLRRIRETSAGRGSDDDPKLSPEDIAVHFVEPDDQGQPRIHCIRIDEEGEFLDPWPRGFFRERSRELYGDDL